MKTLLRRSTGLQRRASSLAPLKMFHSGAFRGSGEVPQELCDVVLTFALLFNDCRDLLSWNDDLQKRLPSDRRLNRFQGEFGGEMSHCMRLLCALVHELGETIKAGSRALNDPFFKKYVVARFPDATRAKWDRVLALAHADPAERRTDRLLHVLRNHAAFHYDAKDLATGFDRRFPAGADDERARQPLFSAGRTISATRFYFADAAALELLEREIEEKRLGPFGPKISGILTDLSVALAAAVEAFIQARSEIARFTEDEAPAGEPDDLSQ